MRTSPRRPLILKRRKLTLLQKEVSSTSGRDENSGHDEKTPKQEHSQNDQNDSQCRDKIDCGLQIFSAGIKIMNHPTMPNTQVVAIPTNADIQSIIEALTAKGKECGNNGPNKFILISSGGTSHSAGLVLSQHLPSMEEPSTVARTANSQVREKNVSQTPDLAGGSMVWHSGIDSAFAQKRENSSGEAMSSVLDNSLTNIQWLGKMRTDGLTPCSVKQGMEKENQIPLRERMKTEEDSAAVSIPSSSSWQDSVSERPPYSYMAMIQFAINSTERKRMTLKDIYTWIEDHFPYFKHVAKPGWKNSIRHNLSLHDMFVRETSANGKISFWTIHPDANRCLTLDQVFKPLDFGSTSSEHSESQQKQHVPDPQKNMGSKSSSKTEPQNARRKMKPLLPRINSYLVPIQFPMSQPLVLQPPLKVPLSVAQGTSHNSSETFQSNKRVRIAPKMSFSIEESSSLPMATVKEESQCDEGFFSPTHSLKENNCQPGDEPCSFPETLCIKEEEGLQLGDWLSPFASTVTVKEEPDSFVPVSAVMEKKCFTILKSPSKGVSDALVIKRCERREMSRSRRKQHLALPCSEEPVLIFPESNEFDPFQLGADLPLLQENQPLENASQLRCLQEERGPFKTPVKEMFSKLPVSSTPCKVPATTTPPLGGLDPWKSALSAKRGNELDFSPVRTLPLPFTPCQENQDLLGFNSTPLKSPLPESSWELLNTESNDTVHSPLTSSPSFSHKSTKQLSLELPASGFTENRSLVEGLILDTMNDSLSKILLDISFPGLEDENLGTDISWSQLIPELK
ncbi:forkhead box protein M1 isoform X8 [Gallus gallus]|uniref:Forkhead box protein M1 n=1 Tax=Gallus gallus TaxID=9031 RepID=F1NHA5_CHICK|nr:forkhead box protein M1 [Gallus gallus]XP_040517206.1 forkhead box protein M1 isoform X3 [Gallus gallus]XP_040517217.1 forkhead box protein M1 isoform X3 [Gallus gallus]XP_040517234.1 forkhead box protein M1 isoform X3 [Gallus gallus]XP_040517243.1 forkhead box protein M1 isoform X3 [Gallus gallus]XP_046765961.1 forkhead box protein M1 isoform X8 [Gallus gallus]XP_046765962.1 forkhead box protein M1 isoform X8 [Gallus gallus]XP_046765963.1 forkhead box protein M1 isoform X8 [Gallus gallus|eukprot:XP_015148145.1 forkhead box protein M1 isoform X2 [Gallus gallus]